VAGTSDLLALQHALIFVEDRFLPVQFDEAKTPLRRTFGIAYRFGKWFGLDLPQDHFLIVVAHEVFGHGARLREIGATDIHYHFDVPIPYGPGGGSTAFNGDLSAIRAEVLAIDTAGIEAQNVIADWIGRQALARGALTYRESWTYLESRLDGLRYIRSVSPQSAPGHDVADFLQDFNDGCNPPVCTPLDESTLKQRALWMLADPLLAYAAYDMFVTYMVRGQISGTVPMIPLPHDLKYLPAVRFEMTPYGTEWTSEHDIVGSGRLTRVSLRFGDTGRSLAWGIGLIATDLVHVGRVAAQVSAEVWRQPALDAPPSSTALATGGLAAATLNVALGGQQTGQARSVLCWRAVTNRMGTCAANGCTPARSSASVCLSRSTERLDHRKPSTSIKSRPA